MEPVPYRIQAEDVDEVLSAYDPLAGGEWTEEARQAARAHVMRNVLEIDDTVRTVPEDERAMQGTLARVRSAGRDPGGDEPVRREAALAAIEDVLIRDGFITLAEGERRVFPALTYRDQEPGPTG